MVTSSPETNFERVTSFNVEYAPAKISKWRSKRTGLTLTHVDQPSPIVNGYFAVATEIEDDTGCPHTLEHLVFMGSKKYPYKGLLDSLGNRFFSSTNAWTGVDQTVYTLTTAGWEGFKVLLPIYLEHLFSPELTDEACLTEIYHIDGRGKEKGVVFSEMQGIENQSWFISFNNMQKVLYKPNSGYSSETGGLTQELRKLTNDDIKNFHKSMYRPDNVCVIITGTIDESELMNVMTEFDESLPLLPSIPNRRPFVDSEPDLPLQKDIIKEIDFPDTDESMGELLISWIGPDGNDVLNNVATDVFGSYLTDSAISILNKQLVEVEDPLATLIEFNTDDYLRTTLNIIALGIPVDKLALVDNEIKRIVKEQTDPLNIDLEYLRQIIEKERVRLIFRTEKSPATLSNVAISDFIYGKDDGSYITNWAKTLNDYDILKKWSSDKWSHLINEYFVQNGAASILAKPSSALYKSQKELKKAFSKRLKEKYGEEGLKKLQHKLDSAEAKNNKTIPDELLTQFGKPDPSKIPLLNTNSYRAGLNNMDLDYIDDDEFLNCLKTDTPEDFNLALHFEDYLSEFVTINFVVSPPKSNPRLLQYSAVIEDLFTLPIRLPDGTDIPYDKVISALDEDLTLHEVELGFNGEFSELFNFKLCCRNDKYRDAITWLWKVLKYADFDESRVKIIVEKLINTIPEKKRSGELILDSANNRALFNDNSLIKAQDFLHTEEFYKEVLLKINDGKFEEVRKDLNDFRDLILGSADHSIFIIGNAKKIPNPVSSWAEFSKYVKQSLAVTKAIDVPRSFQFKSELGKKCSSVAHICTIPATDSSYLISFTPIPTDYLHEDIFKIALASEFLNAVEGPFWRGIRGKGLAYGTNIVRYLELGFLGFSLYRASDANEAWTSAKSIVESFCDGTAEIDPISIENAIATIVQSLVFVESNLYDAAYSKIINGVFKKRGTDYLSLFLKKLNTLTRDDIVYALKKYFVPLFSSQSSAVFACLPTSKLHSFEDFMSRQGYQITTEQINVDKERQQDDDSDYTESSEDDSDASSDEHSDR